LTLANKKSAAIVINYVVHSIAYSLERTIPLESARVGYFHFGIGGLKIDVRVDGIIVIGFCRWIWPETV